MRGTSEKYTSTDLVSFHHYFSLPFLSHPPLHTPPPPPFLSPCSRCSDASVMFARAALTLSGQNSVRSMHSRTVLCRNCTRLWSVRATIRVETGTGRYISRPVVNPMTPLHDVRLTAVYCRMQYHAQSSSPPLGVCVCVCLGVGLGVVPSDHGDESRQCPMGRRLPHRPIICFRSVTKARTRH